jgi:hypothetical protein
MLRLKTLLFFILLIGFKTLSAQIKVTSNADSGPGTLREALQSSFKQL